jgi:glutamate synthase domain-containing protein 3
VAERLLARWDDQPPTFVKVMPRDYRTALERLAQAEPISNEKVGA